MMIKFLLAIDNIENLLNFVTNVERFDIFELITYYSKLNIT